MKGNTARQKRMYLRNYYVRAENFSQVRTELKALWSVRQ